MAGMYRDDLVSAHFQAYTDANLAARAGRRNPIDSEKTSMISDSTTSQNTEPFDLTRICTLAAHCPVCWKENGCRLETGESYKGPCWCEGPTLSSAALNRLLADAPEQRCLCRSCLTAIAANSEITWDELVALSNPDRVAIPQPLREDDYYMEGENLVFTASYHLRRGACCESGCRHCPYSGDSKASGE